MKSDLKLNVDKQQDDIKLVQEQCDVDDEDEVQEMTGTRNLMKKNKALYVTFNQTFVRRNGMKKHIQEEQTELSYTYMQHVNQPVINGPQKMK